MGVVTRDVKSIKAQGEDAIKGDAVLIGGTNVTLGQSGQEITITSTASGGGDGTLTSIQEGGTPVGGDDIVTLNFNGADFNLTESPDTLITIDIEDSGIDHGNLTGLSTGADHSYIDQDVTSGSTPTLTGTNITGLVTTSYGDNTVTSAKLEDDLEFGTFPLTPSAAPDANYEVANKKYVDDEVDAIDVLPDTAIKMTIDGGGSELSTGVALDIEIPFDCTINSARALADRSGSVVIDLWVDSFANYPPTDADSITSTHPVTISSTTKSSNTLIGWTRSLAKDDTLRVNVDSVTSIKRVTISLGVTKT